MNFSLHSWNLYQFLNILKKKLTLIAYVFPKIQTAKYVVRQMSKNLRFRTPFDSQYVKWCQTFVKSAWQHFNQISSPLRAKLTWKMSLLVTFEILGHFVNTLTVCDKYSLCNSDKLLQPFQMQLSRTRKTFSQFFAPFMISTSNFENFEKRDVPDSLCISENTDCERGG